MTSCKEMVEEVLKTSGMTKETIEDVRLCPISLMKPLITKMDYPFTTLTKCQILRLSSNAIAKIDNVSAMSSLKILSIGRNSLKKIEGLPDTLEQLWCSYNQLSSLQGLAGLPHLMVLYASNNKIDKWQELERLTSNQKLRELNLVNNPIWKMHSDDGGGWRVEVIKRIETLKNLDGALIEDEEREAAKAAD